MTDEWLSLSDAAKVLGVHPSTVRFWSDKGVLPTHKTQGGHRRYKQAEISLWAQSNHKSGADRTGAHDAGSHKDCPHADLGRTLAG